MNEWGTGKISTEEEHIDLLKGIKGRFDGISGKHFNTDVHLKEGRSEFLSGLSIKTHAPLIKS